MHAAKADHESSPTEEATIVGPQGEAPVPADESLTTERITDGELGSPPARPSGAER